MSRIIRDHGGSSSVHFETGKSMKEQSELQIEIVHEGEEPTYSQDGVDLTLIRWTLSLSPFERLRHLESIIDSIRQLRGELDEED